MKQTVIILLSFLLLLGCRAKKLEKKSISETKQKLEAIKQEKKSEISDKQIHKTDTKVLEKQKEQRKDSDIEIKGKSETDKPFEVHQIENGDTISSIKIIGNADFIIKSKNHNSERSTDKKEQKEQLNELQKISREAVSQETISKAANEIKDIAKKVETTGFQFGAYAMFFGWGIVIIALIALFLWFRKTNLFKNIVERLKQKR